MIFRTQLAWPDSNFTWLKPILGGWINDTGVYYASNPAMYTFERPFSIAAGTTSLTCNFGITTDDFIVSLELVRPDSSTIPLTIPASPAYTVSPAITNVISSPMAGTWKIRVVTNFFDTTAGLLVSGTITKSDQTIVCLPATKDAMLHQFTPTTNYGSNTLLRASRHTYTSGGGSGFYTTKVLHQFDLSSIPAGAVITSAIMKLHVNTNPSAIPYNYHYDLGGGTGNGASVRQVAGPWAENTVTWNTAPLLFLTPVTVPSLGNGSTADVVSNVTTMVQNMILTGINNGFEISLTDNSNYYQEPCIIMMLIIHYIF